MIQAVIYDMDGVLINSEPLWQKTEIRIFQEVGVPMTLAMSHETMGMRTNEVVDYWYTRYPWENPSREVVEEKIWNDIVEIVKTEGIAMPGVYESLSFFKEKNIKLGLASASSMRLITAVMEKLKIKDYFDVIHSAEFEEYGKPHPGVYITTAKQLGVDPTYVIAIEDTVNGMISAKSAKMKVIAIPDPLIRDDKRLHLADFRLNSLIEINASFWDMLQ